MTSITPPNILTVPLVTSDTGVIAKEWSVTITRLFKAVNDLLTSSDTLAAKILDPCTVGQLPTSSAPGVRGFVTDATATTFMATVAGGGANGVPVVWNGTAWKIG